MDSSQIYFAVSAGRMKIGTTGGNVKARIAAISAALPEPLTLLGCIEGGLPLERAVQSRLSQFRLRGEWFGDCDETRRVFRNLSLGGPAAIGFTGAIHRPTPEHSRRTTDPNAPRIRLADIAALMWSDRKEAIARLSGFSGESREICEQWLNGSAKPPRLFRPALMMLLFFAFEGCQDDVDDLTSWSDQ